MEWVDNAQRSTPEWVLLLVLTSPFWAVYPLLQMWGRFRQERSEPWIQIEAGNDARRRLQHHDSTNPRSR